jgi:putative ABC transport system ATP-binding protein
MNSSPLFQLEDVSATLGGKDILDAIRLQVPPGEFLAILGPSGSGKSTLLRLFNGLDTPTTGEIRYRGQLLHSYPMTRLRKRVGMVFQTPVLTAGSVRDNLCLIQRWERPAPELGEDVLTAVLEQVELLPEILDQDAGTLSGGEKQRLALARVLLNQPEVLLLDEPTANLDPQLSRRILRLIQHLYRRLNLTVIMVSHQHDLVTTCATRVAFLIDGRIVEEGPVDILTHPTTAPVRSFLALEP